MGRAADAMVGRVWGVSEIGGLVGGWKGGGSDRTEARGERR